MGEFAGVQNDYFTVGTQLVGSGVPQRYIGFSPLTSSYKHAAGARNDFGAGFSFQDYTIGAYCRRNGDHLSIFVGATVNGESVSRGSDGGVRGIGSVGSSTITSQVFTVPYGNTQPIDYNIHGSSANSETAWFDGTSSSNSTNPYSNHKEIYRLENACASDGPTAEPHSGGNGSGEFVIPSFLAFLSTLGLGNIAGIMIYYIFPLTLSIACQIYESPLKLWWSRTSGTLVAAFCVGWFIGAASVAGADVFSF